jgi:hypothetical protein
MVGVGRVTPSPRRVASVTWDVPLEPTSRSQRLAREQPAQATKAIGRIGIERMRGPARSDAASKREPRVFGCLLNSRIQ